MIIRLLAECDSPLARRGHFPKSFRAVADGMALASISMIEYRPTRATVAISAGVHDRVLDIVQLVALLSVGDHRYDVWGRCG